MQSNVVLNDLDLEGVVAGLSKSNGSTLGGFRPVTTPPPAPASSDH